MTEQQTPDREKKIAEIRESLEKIDRGDLFEIAMDYEKSGEWVRFLLGELDQKEGENRKLREELDAAAEGYRQQVKLSGELMDKLAFVQEQEQKLIKKLREIAKLLGGVTFTDGRQWGAYNALCDIVKDWQK